MKKISLIACAALVAGLLVSCNNATEAGNIDYNDVRTTSTENSYLVSGTIETVREISNASYDDKDKQNGGDYSKTTVTEEIVSTAASVIFGEDSLWESNFANYFVQYDRSTGYTSTKYNEKKDWDGTKLADVTKPADIDKASEPDTTIYGDVFALVSVDGTVYEEYDGQNWTVEVDEDALQSGDDFTLKVTYEIINDSNGRTMYDSEGNQSSRSEFLDKSTITYNFKFTAK